MASTNGNSTQRQAQEICEPLHWRSWPLVDQSRWSWLVVFGIVAVGGLVWYLGGGWLLAVAAIGGLAAVLWQFLLPIRYEIDARGLRRRALRRSRLIPWHAVRAYQLRPTGVVLYRRDDPTTVDLLRSLFVPFPADEDSMLCALREHLPHAVELPQ